MTAPSAQRICIRLDPAMLLEGLLIERLSRVPKARRQEWLRALLVQGYLWEGGASRRGQRHAACFVGDQVEQKSAAWGRAYAHWLARSQPAMPSGVPGSGASGQARPVMPETPETEKPFAYLRKVIG